MSNLPTVLNQAGLFLGVVGGLIMFKWGPPQPDFIEGTVLLSADPERQADAHAIRALKQKHLWLSRVGLGLVVVSFLAQFTATLLPGT